MNYEITFCNNLLSIHQDGNLIYEKDFSGVPDRKMYNAKALAIEAALVMHTAISQERCEDIALDLIQSGYARPRA